MASNTSLSLRLVAFVTLSVFAGQTVADILSLDRFDILKEKFNNATIDIQKLINHEVPAVKKEAEVALTSYAEVLQNSAQSIQNKVEQYNLTSAGISGQWGQIRDKVNTTVIELADSHPEVNILFGQVKSGFLSMVDVGKQVTGVVEAEGEAAADDLKAVAEHVHAELSKAASQLEDSIPGKVKGMFMGK